MKTRIIEVNPRHLKLLETNARFMRHETYQRLITNIKADGKLTSVPFCALWKVWADGDALVMDDAGEPVYEVLSGNHRVRAAIDAGLENINVMVTDEPLDRGRRTLIQLSHNSLVGEDDPATLKQLYDSLDIDLRPYSGLDDKTLDMLSKVSASNLSEPNLDFQVMTFAFLPDEIERARECFDRVKSLIKGDEVWMSRMADYDRFMDTLENTGSSFHIRNAATILMLMLDIVERHIEELSQGWEGEDKAKHDGWVPMVSIYGNDKMPAQAAMVVKKAVDKMVGKGDLSPKARWQATEMWAADYLAGR